MNKDLELNAATCLVNPDAQQLKALARLSDNSDFVTFFDYLETCLSVQDKKNRVANNDVALRQGQGISQALESEISIILSAKDVIRRSATG